VIFYNTAYAGHYNYDNNKNEIIATALFESISDAESESEHCRHIARMLHTIGTSVYFFITIYGTWRCIVDEH
jgi:hypothetical protein